MSTSTKIDLFTSTATSSADSLKIPAAEAECCNVQKCVQEPLLPSKTTAVAKRRLFGNETVLIMLCALTVAFYYTSHTNRVLTEKVQHLQNLYNELALRAQQSTSSGARVGSAAIDDVGDRPTASETGAPPVPATRTPPSGLQEPELKQTTESVERFNEEWKEPGSGGWLDTDDDYVDYDGLIDDEMSGEGNPAAFDVYFDTRNRVERLLSGLPQAEQAVLPEDGEVKVRSRRSAESLASGGVSTANDDDDDDDPAGPPVSQRPRHPSNRRSSADSPQQRQAPSRPFDRTPQRHRTPGQQSSSTEIKVAQFVAPRQDGHYVSDNSLPPVTYRFWQPDNLTLSLRPQFFRHDNETGLVTVLEPGVYLLYAQIVYHDLTGRWAFGVYVDDMERFKCINTEQLQHHPHLQSSRRESDVSGQSGSRAAHSHAVYQTCYTSGLLRLKMYDKLSLRCLYGGKSVVMQPGFTYWGLVKLVSL